MTDAPSPLPSDDALDQAPGLTAAVRDIVAPLARLAIAKGMRYPELDELLKGALVEAARQAHADVPLSRVVSRISTATGINRREVTRLTHQASTESSKPRSVVNELYARWSTDPGYLQHGQPMRLPRLGADPSFEGLATSVNKDVRPRSLLDELCRLGMAKVHEDDTVELLQDKFVPSQDERQMFAFLGANVGDHLQAAVHNVMGHGVRTLEQALFTDALSASSVEVIRPKVSAQWQSVVRSLAPEVQSLMDHDKAQQHPQDHRLRIGMYMYAAPLARTPEADEASAPPKKETP